MNLRDVLKHTTDSRDGALVSLLQEGEDAWTG